MRIVTIVSLSASVALGLGALMVAKLVIPAQGSAQAAAAPAPAPMANAVSIVVAAQDIPFGQRLDARNLKLIRVPKEAAPEGAFSTLEQALAQDHGGAPVALAVIAAREPILPARISGPGARPSVAAELAPDMRAYAIRVSDVSGVGGHALPGDFVDVVLMRNISPDESKKVLQSEVVIQNARVLGIDLNADLTSNKPATPQTATLEVSVADAQKLSVAADLGSLSLALRPSGMTRIDAIAPLNARDVLSRTAAGPGAGANRTRRSGSSSAPSRIIVVEGEPHARPAGV
jgi:pilus assembly protein CpaB